MTKFTWGLLCLCMCCDRHPQLEVGGRAAGRWGRQRGLVVQADIGQVEKRCLLQCLIAYAVFFSSISGSVIRSMC